MFEQKKKKKKVFKRNSKSKLWIIAILYFRFINTGPHGRKNLKRHSLWTYTPYSVTRTSPKTIATQLK